MIMHYKSQALLDIIAERVKQDKKWGERYHGPFPWLAILMEEVGELAKAMLIAQSVDGETNGGLDEVREEAIHVAAVAITFVECLDRSVKAETSK